MKVDFLSDLHIDFYFDPKQKIKDEKIKKLYHPIITENDRKIGGVLIVAGDIGHYNHQNIKVLKYLKEHYYKHIICVLGNHDYYLFDKDSKVQFKDSFERAEQMRLRINREENMYCLNGNFIQIDGVVLEVVIHGTMMGTLQDNIQLKTFQQNLQIYNGKKQCMMER